MEVSDGYDVLRSGVLRAYQACRFLCLMRLEPHHLGGAAIL